MNDMSVRNNYHYRSNLPMLIDELYVQLFVTFIENQLFLLVSQSLNSAQFDRSRL